MANEFMYTDQYGRNINFDIIPEYGTIPSWDTQEIDSEYKKEIQFFQGYNLCDEALPFNWYNSDGNITSEYQAWELVTANELIEECGPEYKEMIWEMLCE